MTTPDRAALSEEIASWDGKSADALQRTYERHCAEEGFVATILAHIVDVELQRAATWLLKKHLETGNSLTAACCRAVFCALPVQEHWESKLHILQCVSYLEIPEDKSADLEKFLEACLGSDNKFVRAWTYNGFTNCRCASRDTGTRWTACSPGPAHRKQRRFGQEFATCRKVLLSAENRPPIGGDRRPELPSRFKRTNTASNQRA